MPSEISPQRQDYLDYQDSVKDRPQDVQVLLCLYEKARAAGLPQEARLHLLRAANLDPRDERTQTLLRQELTGEEYADWQKKHQEVIPFWKDLGRIVLFPAGSEALLRWVLAALALSLGRIFEDLMRLWPSAKIVSVPLFALGGIAWFFMIILLPGFFRAIVARTAGGDDELPPWPSLADFWGEAVLPTVKSLLIFFWSFLPLSLVISAWLRTNVRPSPILVVFSLLFGFLYFPLAFLMFSISGKLWPSLLPSQVVEAAAKTIADYLRLVLIFWMLLLPAGMSLFLWNLPVIGALIPAFVSLYCWAAAMRLLGRFYRLEAGRLEWR